VEQDKTPFLRCGEVVMQRRRAMRRCESLLGQEQSSCVASAPWNRPALRPHGAVRTLDGLPNRLTGRRRPRAFLDFALEVLFTNHVR